MSLTINAIYHGFKVLEASFVEEVHSKAYIMEHLGSGARLLYLANDDDNKVFFFFFFTTTADDKGVVCILEQSLLCRAWHYFFQ